MINIFQPAVGSEELAAVQRVFESSWLGRGAVCKLFEVEFARHVKADTVLLFNCCTSALYTGLKSIGIGPGVEVIIPTVHFVATMNAVLELGATPVLADVDQHTLNVIPDEIERLTTDKTAAVLLLHYGGHPCDINAIRDVCGGDVAIIEDAAGAVASSYYSRPCGTLGDMGVWSFDAMKTMTMGDGGALWLVDAECLERARMLRYFGLDQFSGLDVLRSGEARWWEYGVVEPSGRFISNDILAAIGIAQFGKLSNFVKRRWQIWQIYQEQLLDLPICLPPEPLPFCKSTYYLYWIQTEDRDGLAAYLANEGVYTTFRYYPLNRAFGITGDFLNADYIAETTLNLPIHPSLTDDEIGYICQTIRNYFEDGG